MSFQTSESDAAALAFQRWGRVERLKRELRCVSCGWSVVRFQKDENGVGEGAL